MCRTWSKGCLQSGHKAALVAHFWMQLKQKRCKHKGRQAGLLMSHRQMGQQWGSDASDGSACCVLLPVAIAVELLPSNVSSTPEAMSCKKDVQSASFPCARKSKAKKIKESSGRRKLRASQRVSLRAEKHQQPSGQPAPRTDLHPACRLGSPCAGRSCRLCPPCRVGAGTLGLQSSEAVGSHSHPTVTSQGPSGPLGEESKCPRDRGEAESLLHWMFAVFVWPCRGWFNLRVIKSCDRMLVCLGKGPGSGLWNHAGREIW